MSFPVIARVASAHAKQSPPPRGDCFTLSSSFLELVWDDGVRNDDHSGDCFVGLRSATLRKGLLAMTVSFGFVLVFLLFSGLFFFNSFKLWFKTDTYYEDIYNSLTRQPPLYPFRDFFLKRMENKKRWVLWQKIFSTIGLAAVIGADILVIAAWRTTH